MPLFRNVHTLLDMPVAKSESQTGSGYRVVPNEGDDVGDTAQLFRVFFDLTQSGGASSPTTEASLETSWDAESWFKVVGSSQVNADGTTHEWKEAAALGPWVRATTKLGGGTPPSHKVTVKLCSTAPFRLRAE